MVPGIAIGTGMVPGAGGARGAERKRRAGLRAEGGGSGATAPQPPGGEEAGPSRAPGAAANRRARGLRAAPAAAILWEGRGEGQSAAGTAAAGQVRGSGPGRVLPGGTAALRSAGVPATFS